MDSLPSEILSGIIDILEISVYRRELGRFACISLSWQAAVERRTFHTVPVKPDRDSLDYLREVLLVNNTRRLDYIRVFEILPGEYPFEVKEKPGIPTRVDSTLWNAAMAQVFVALAEILGSRHETQPVCLQFEDYAPNIPVLDWEAAVRDGPKSVPELRCVDRMVTRGPMNLIAEVDLYALTDKLPDLKSCELVFWDAYDWGRRLRISHREKQASSLVARDFPGLRTLTLRAIHSDQRDETRHPVDLMSVSKEDYIDPARRIVRHLTTLPQLVHLYLTGSHVVSANYFQDLPSFPLLEEFQLDFATYTTDGKWFFVEDDALMAIARVREEGQSVHYIDSDLESDSEPVEFWDTDDEDGPIWQRGDFSNHFRTMPDPETVPELLLGAARMVSSCTRLRKFILRHRRSAHRNLITWNYDELTPYGRNLEIWYVRSGTRCNYGNRHVPADQAFVNLDRMYWRVGDRWRPDASIVGAWQAAVGLDVNYCFLRDIYDLSGKSITWQIMDDLERRQYILDLEWEEPGGTIDLELGKLKPCFEYGHTVFGPWPFDRPELYDYYRDHWREPGNA